MEDLGKSFPAAEGMVEAESGGNKPHPNEFCLNCGTKLEDVYCHHCGQKDIPRRQTLGELFINFISSFWSYEGKFFLTTKYIFLKPGFLAVEYNEGRRESYFHPARMYVFVSFLFFLLFFSLPDSDNGAVQGGLTKEDEEELSKIGLKADTVKGKKDRKVTWSFRDPLFKTHEEYDSAQAAAPEDQKHSWFERKMQHRAIELQKKYGNDADALGKDFLSSFNDNFSKVLFYLMPFFALVLKLLYVRRDYFYSEHLVQTIYYYNFFYLGGCIIMLLNLVWWLTPVSVVIGIWMYFYLLFAMKRMYQQGWGKTILKFMLFTALFSVLILIGITINGLASLMML
ncbi:MAG TPA: DUF3667 domain-containing protein [Cyclobacteriaceae bacterium]|nr:DUF3667 domain-containing protein [Cyclobacteriaceae bacterium]